MPDPQKRARADFVIPTGGTIQRTRAAVDGIVACLRARRVR
jgi:dephospho-CoA kinase